MHWQACLRAQCGLVDLIEQPDPLGRNVSLEADNRIVEAVGAFEAHHIGGD